MYICIVHIYCKIIYIVYFLIYIYMSFLQIDIYIYCVYIYINIYIYIHDVQKYRKYKYT